jgi:hypothetical protein
MRYVTRPAGQTRGLAEGDDCAVRLVNEEIAILDQQPEDSAEALRIDAIERQESFDVLMRIDRKQRPLIASAGHPQH